MNELYLFVDCPFSFKTQFFFNPKNGCFQSFHTARKTLNGYEAILWIKKGLGFKGKWTINEQIKLIQNIFGLNKPLAC
ncbi:hypothetical protein [Commensalibacter nepenthis]|uniref:Transposase n=1 Tax=Commensalibacter nepenthis TaxID=3043872 RepID=A0ABT6Q709_9PROT|nr:hypothetical protein [Commensalibacter sp. TBRC 10068]MDI2112678.1 hypothetical protein [Commensalibacter sp. TBRC 10068]